MGICYDPILSKAKHQQIKVELFNLRVLFDAGQGGWEEWEDGRNACNNDSKATEDTSADKLKAIEENHKQVCASCNTFCAKSHKETINQSLVSEGEIDWDWFTIASDWMCLFYSMSAPLEVNSESITASVMVSMHNPSKGRLDSLLADQDKSRRMLLSKGCQLAHVRGDINNGTQHVAGLVLQATITVRGHDVLHPAQNATKVLCIQELRRIERSAGEETRVTREALSRQVEQNKRILGAAEHGQKVR